MSLYFKLITTLRMDTNPQPFVHFVPRCSGIPNTIYLIGPDESYINKFTRAIENTRQLNPEFEIKIFDDRSCEEFIRQRFSDRVYCAYKMLNPEYGPAQGDFARYCVIYEMGGVYMDMKSSSKKPLYQLLSDHPSSLLVSHWPHILNPWMDLFFPHGEYQNWHIVSPKGHPALRAVIENIVLNIESEARSPLTYPVGKLGVLALTGPITYTRTLKNTGMDGIEVVGPNLQGYLEYCHVDHIKTLGRDHYTHKRSMLLNARAYRKWG